jgi:predicted dehydrogenase
VNDLPHAKLFASDRAEDERAVTSDYPGMEKGDLLPDFIDAIRSGRQPQIDETDIFRVMDVCFSVWEASQSGQRVKINYLI